MHRNPGFNLFLHKAVLERAVGRLQESLYVEHLTSRVVAHGVSLFLFRQVTRSCSDDELTGISSLFAKKRPNFDFYGTLPMGCWCKAAVVSKTRCRE